MCCTIRGRRGDQQPRPQNVVSMKLHEFSPTTHHVSASPVSSSYILDMVMEDTTSNMSSATAATASTSLRTSPIPPRIVPIAASGAAAESSGGESVDSFEESLIKSSTSSRPQRPQTTLSWSSYQPRHSTSTRRERSMSSVVNPYALSRGSTAHQRSSSAAVLDLDYSSSEAKAKRRSLSTCGDSNSVSPPAKAAKSFGEESSNTLKRPTSSRTKLSSKASVRFDESKSPKSPPSKCHHLLSDDEPQQPLQPQAVQRTHSNPEMELCPVCLARKECEILLKRTYSKVYNNE